MKNELSKLRFENQRLQRRKDELELFVEQIKLKEGFGIGNGEREYKVIYAEIAQWRSGFFDFD